MIGVGGRPALYDTAEELEKAIDAYFSSETKPTVTRLAYNLGFESRQSIYDYKDNGKFSYIIKRAILYVESCYEGNLHGTTPTGSIFALKNMKWKDTVDQNVNGNVAIVFERATPSDVSPD